MKKILFILITIHFSFQFLHAQWVQQVSGTTDQLLKVKFINRYTGWTCGYNGRMLKTTNGGVNWVIQNTGISGKSLRGLSVVDSNIIYSAGLDEVLIKTTNGGNNWIILKNGSIDSYWGSYFINENTGWLCSADNKVLKTTNGGISFDSVYIPSTFMYDIYFRNSTEGLICGQSAAMYKTTNGGLNWSFITVPTGGDLSDFMKFSFINTNTGFIVGGGNRRLFKTTNFGTNWDSVSHADGYYDAYTLFFVNEFTGWIGGSSGFLRKTTNGGYNWYPENITQFGNGFFGGIYFYNDTIGWAVGAPGKILYTESGGQITDIVNNPPWRTNSFELYQNYPNPFNQQTKIKFNIVKNDEYKLEIFDILGKKVDEIFNKSFKVGSYEINYNADKLSSGIYIYKLSSEKSFLIKKLLLIK